MRTGLFGFGAAILLSSAASAEWVQQPYTEWAKARLDTFTAIGQQHGLDAATTQNATNAAVIWHLTGPCRSGDPALSTADVTSSLDLVNSYDPRNRFTSAVVEMVGFLASEGLGREPTEYSCRFARELAVPAR
jgi:opacity protein-like surface antigen